MAKKGNSHHVVPDSEGGWDVKRSGSSRASAHAERNIELANIAPYNWAFEEKP